MLEPDVGENQINETERPEKSPCMKNLQQYDNTRRTE